MGKSKKLSTDGRSGGLLVGKTDIDGGIGIPATVGGSRNVILGGGEIIINEAAAKLHCEKLDEINQSTGGRSIDCEAQKTANKGRFDGGGRAGGGDEGGEVGDKNELDKEIFLSLLKIYKSEGNSGKDLFSFSEYKLGKILSQNAFDRIKSGKSPLGKFGLYGGGLGQYYALDIANGDFYKRISENYAKGGMYWMGNEGDRVVVDKSGQGDFTSYYLIREKCPYDMVSMSFDSRFEAEKYAKRRKMVLVDKYVDAKGSVENKKTGKAIIVSYEKDKDVKNQVGLAIENIIYPYDYKITKGDKSFDFPKKKTVYFYKITPKNEGDMEKIVGSLGVLVSSKKILSIYQDSTDKYAGGGMADGEIDKAFDGSLNSFQELAKKYNK